MGLRIQVAVESGLELVPVVAANYSRLVMASLHEHGDGDGNVHDELDEAVVTAVLVQELRMGRKAFPVNRMEEA